MRGGSAVEAELDVDARYGKGPETITIYKEAKGTYKFHVILYINIYNKIGGNTMFKKGLFLCLLTAVIFFAGCGSGSDVKHWKFRYNDDGKISKIIRPGKEKIEMEYNERGELASLESDDHHEKYEYDCFGNLNRIHDNTGQTMMKHDIYGRLLEMTYPTGDKLTYKYNENGKITGIAWGGKHFLKFSHDLFGRTIKVESPAGEFKIVYSPKERKAWRNYPNGAYSSYAYNRDGKVEVIEHVSPGPKRYLIVKYRYTYDDAGLLQTAVEEITGGKLTVNYTYDANGQLTKAGYSDGRVYTFTYDSFGNRINHSSPSSSYTAAYNNQDQIEKMSEQPVRHDDAGNVTKLGDSNFTYNIKDSLIDDGTRKYKYNALGLRVQASGKEGKRQFFHFIDDLPYLLAETGKTNKHYLWADGQCLGQIDGNGKVLYFLEDHLGTVRYAMDNDGNIVGEAEFSPFGVPIQRIPGVRFGFAGEEQDEQGKIYLRSRYYLPEIGRFLSEDPVPLQLMASIKQNRYAYAANSPMNFKDSEGAYPDHQTFLWNKAKKEIKGELQYIRDKIMAPIDYLRKREKNTMYLFDNVVGRKEKGLKDSEGGKFSTWLYNKPGVSHTAVYHDAGLAILEKRWNLESKPKIVQELANYGTMPPAYVVGAAHYSVDFIAGPKLTKKLRNKIWDIAKSQEDKSVKSDPPTSPPPNVGGVYLSKAAEVLEELGGIEGVVLDPKTNRLVLIGSNNSDKSLPPIRLDDMAAAFRNVFGNYKLDPGVTIDPHPKNPKGKEMIVRFFGGMENTHFGHVLFETDRLMKCLGLGQDNITQKPISTNVKGYKSWLELFFANPGGEQNEKELKKDLWQRFWLVPDKVVVRVAEDGKSVEFPDTRIMIKTETMEMVNGKLVPAKMSSSKNNTYFASHFTENYDQYAKEFPVYRELKNLANIVALAKWLKEKNVEVDLDWLKKYDKSSPTPTKTPALTTRKKGLAKIDGKTIPQVGSIYGGTDLNIKNKYEKGDNQLSREVQHSFRETASSPGAAAVDFVDNKGLNKKAVALPTSQTRAAGAKMIHEQELELLTRSFCSFHNHTGKFGRSWLINLPELERTRQNREYWTYKNTRVENWKFHLTRPFGMQDVTFKKCVVDQEYDCLVFLPAKDTGIRAIYPNDKKGEYKVQYCDGKSETFESGGKILRRDISPAIYLQYSYDPSNRLAKVEKINQNETAGKVILTYDKHGRVSLAETPDNKFTYHYDTNGNLIKVEAKDSITEYAYNDLHLVTGVLQNGKPVLKIEYDSFGRVLKEQGLDENKIKREFKTMDGKTEVTEKIAEGEIKKIYDAGGRLLEYHGTSGESIRLTYDENGRKKSEEYKNKFGDQTKIEYSTDARDICCTYPDGSVQAFKYDELGRVKEIRDKDKVMLTRNYWQTERGLWYEGLESAGTKVHSYYDDKKNLFQYTVNSKVPGGGWIQIENKYAADGTIQSTKVKGLQDDRYIYEKGKLKKIISNNETTEIRYDSNGNPMEWVSGDSGVSLEYIGKQLSRIHLRRGKARETHEYIDGNLVSRLNVSGRHDTFRYDGNGELVESKKGTGERYEIKQNEEDDRKSVIILRNGRKFTENIYNKQGKLLEIIKY